MTDRDLLSAVLAAPGLEPEAEEAFTRMLDDLTSGKWDALTSRQREWVDGVAARLGVDPGAANLVSAGLVKPTAAERESLGRFLGTLHRPLKPPRRSA